MLLLIETWSAACCWFSACTSCSIVRSRLREPLLDPGQRQRQGRAVPLQTARQFRHERLAIGGFERAMSAMTRIRLFGSCSAISIIRSAQAVGQIAIGPAGGNRARRRGADSRSAPDAA